MLRGYEFGPADIYPAYTPNPLLVVLTMIGSIALFVYVGQMFIAMSQHKQLVLFFALSLLSIVGFIVSSGTLLVQIWALSAAIMAPVGALVILMEEWRRSDGTRPIGAWKSTLLALLSRNSNIICCYWWHVYCGIIRYTKFFMEFGNL